ncbi:NAD-dependent epimerase/dehydratase family protein [bacterium]|nr:NAD-dependent epimerase/dehydratase family protein [bacterium]
MHILILGAAGMIGRKLAASLAEDGHRLTLADVVPPPDLPNSTALTLDLTASAAPGLIAGRPDAIIHLAAIVSGEAEADFDKGYATNLDAPRALLEAIRAMPGYVPKLIFASSIAVFGAPFPAKIPDDFFLTPRTSYGTQKAITELLISDYSRRGFIDGLSIRLPTICVRPGKPNLAASGFFSNIIREPLVGKPAVLPVPDTTRHWFASPQSAVGFFRHALTLDTARLGDRRALGMPGLSATVAEEIEALRRVAGQKAVDLITRQPDEKIAKIVSTWPADFETTRASALGFVAETTFDQIIAAHLVAEGAAA